MVAFIEGAFKHWRSVTPHYDADNVWKMLRPAVDVYLRLLPLIGVAGTVYAVWRAVKGV